MARKRKTPKPEQSSRAETAAQTQATIRRPSVPAPAPSVPVPVPVSTSTSSPAAASVQPPVQAPLIRQHVAPPQHGGVGGQAQGQSRVQGPLQGQGQGGDEASSSAPTGRARGMTGVDQGLWRGGTPMHERPSGPSQQSMSPAARPLQPWGRGAPFSGPSSPSYGPDGGHSVQVSAPPAGHGSGLAGVNFLFGSLTVQDQDIHSDVDPPHEPPGPPVPEYEAPATPGPPISSKKETFPKRPGYGRAGQKCMVKANHFPANLPDKDLHQYDVAITPEVTSRGINRAIMEQLVKLYRDSQLGTRLPAYDGRKSLYTAGSFPFQSREFQIDLSNEDDGGNQPRRERTFKVVIKFAARTDLYHLGEFLKGRQADAPQGAVQVLDIVLRELPTHRYSPVGRSFYSPHLGRRQPLGGGLESWRGFYQSIRPTQMGLSLNIDMSSTAFIEPKPVSQFVRDLLIKELTRSLTDADCIKIKKALRGVKVEVTHRGSMRRKYRISGLTSQATRELKFPVDENGTLVFVTDYFRDTYGYIIRYPALPCLQVGNSQRPNYLPMEVCKIVEGQRYSKRLNDRQIDALRAGTCQPPRVREQDIFETVAHNAYDKDPYAQEFGITISNQLAQVEARILPAPRLKYHDSGRERDCLPRLGEWKMTNKKLVNGGTVNNWACINFSRSVVDNVAHNFCQQLAKMCANSGMQFNQRPILIMRSDDRSEASVKALSNLCKEVYTSTKGKGLDLLVAILPVNNGSLYGDLKKQCETVLGVVSQCCLDKHLKHDLRLNYLSNVALKINVKVGGRNTVLVDALARKGFFVSKPTIIFGADVTHPHPGEYSSPSIAAVVASQDWPEATKYAGLVSAQAHRQEIIQDLYTESDDPREKGTRTTGGMIKELLVSFYCANKLKPARIIFYRDGVSEGQFSQVLQYELGAIKKACASLEADYKPTITFVVVQKRHHTRLFASNHDDPRSIDSSSKNILPGTVVDSKICHPTEFDFYLCSHVGIQGTSRPAHYHVLWDENNLTADDLQLLTNNLCYTYARCTRSLSIVPPAQYAHLLAFRARFYMDAEASDTGSATSARSHRVGGGNAVRALPEVHRNLKARMFYC